MLRLSSIEVSRTQARLLRRKPSVRSDPIQGNEDEIERRRALYSQDVDEPEPTRWVLI